MFHHKRKPTFRDRCWVWAHTAGSHDGLYNIPGKGEFNPSRGSAYFGIPNILMVRFHNSPQMPFDDLASSMKGHDIIWSLVGAGGRTSPQERDHIFEIASRNLNIKGFILDDFWSIEGNADGGVVLTAEEVARLKERAGRRELWSTLYESELFRQDLVRPYLPSFDKHTLWFWIPEHLRTLEMKLDLYAQMVPDKDRYLGCYLWDFGKSREIPLEYLKKQCEVGLDRMRSGELKGLIFLATTLCGRGIRAVEWAKDWIAEVGDERFP